MKQSRVFSAGGSLAVSSCKAYLPSYNMMLATSDHTLGYCGHPTLQMLLGGMTVRVWRTFIHAASGMHAMWASLLLFDLLASNLVGLLCKCCILVS